MATNNLTAERLRSLLSYEAESGTFRWRHDRIRGRLRVVNAEAGEVAGSVRPNSGYVRIGIDGRQYFAHRLAWLYTYGAWPTSEIDHRNGVRSDNRLANLRDVSRRVNQQNALSPKHGTASGLLGVFRARSKSERWGARIGVNGKEQHLGTFKTPEAAHAAYIEAKRRLHAGCTL
jgi:hypothetical protein